MLNFTPLEGERPNLHQVKEYIIFLRVNQEIK